MNVHVGNVAEFNEQFEFGLEAEETAAIREACDIYSGIAPFLTDEPSLVVVPRKVADERWWDVLSEKLGWTMSVLTIEVPPSESLCQVVADQPDFRSALSTVRGTVVGWGETPHLRSLLEDWPHLAATRGERFDVQTFIESKSGCLEVLAAAAEGSRSISVPRSRTCWSNAELMHAVRSLGRDGRRLVAKSNFGVSGFGTSSLDPAWAAGTAAEGLLGHLISASHRYSRWPIVVQEEVPRVRASAADLTGDAEVLPDGSVEYRGSAAMLVESNHYGGAVTACASMFPQDGWAAIESFTLEVGSIVSDLGYRGWFDVDFLASVDSQIYALEINARRTGPIAAFTIAGRARELGLGTAVACRDAVNLPRRYTPAQVYDAYWAVQARHGGRIVPTSFLGLDASSPVIGLAAIADDASEAVDLLDVGIDELGRYLLEAEGRVPCSVSDGTAVR